MAGQRYRASIIIDLMGNLAQRSRQFSNHLTTMSRSGQSSLRALRTEVVRVSGAIDKMGSLSTGAFRSLSAGALGIVGMGYTANKLFVSIASQRENQRIALNSLYKGDKAHAQKMMDWAIQNAKDSTWGLSGVMQELVSSKSFGMSDVQAKNFITMLQDQGALHGWSLDAAQGASLQLKQMFSRQQITAADANLLTGYGINVYQVLADRWGKDVKLVRKAGEKGNLGLKSIIDLFQALSEESKGAQKNAMNSWTGLTAQMGDVWEDFANKVMNKGPFERLKGQLRHTLQWYDLISNNGQLDAMTDEMGARFNQAFDVVKESAQEAWRYLKIGKNALSWVDENIIRLKTLAKVLGGIWLANKALRLGWAVARPAWQAASWPVRTTYRGYRWLRRRKKPNVDNEPLVNASALLTSSVQPVFVTNWPMGAGLGGGFGQLGHSVPAGRNLPYRSGGALPSSRSPVLPAPSLLGLPPPSTIGWPTPRAGMPYPNAPAALPAGKRGFFSQALSGTGQWLADMGRSAGALVGRVGQAVSNSTVGRIAAKSASTLSRVGKIGGRVLSRVGNPLMAALSVAPVLMDENATIHDKASAIGGTTGAWAGGAVGSLLGPVGTVAGATIGGVVGDYLGGFVADLYTKWDGKSAEPPPEQKVNAEAALRIDLADGLRLTSTTVTEDGMGLNVFTGNNFISGW